MKTAGSGLGADVTKKRSGSVALGATKTDPENVVHAAVHRAGIVAVHGAIIRQIRGIWVPISERHVGAVLCRHPTPANVVGRVGSNDP